MSDHEFEKQVQQKLGELKLRPSDTIWVEVEKNIRHQKRRRRILWLPVLFVCLTTSGYFFYRQVYQSGQTNHIAKATPSSKSNTITTVVNENNSTHNSPNAQGRQTNIAEPVNDHQLQQPKQITGTAPVVTPTSPIHEKQTEKITQRADGARDNEHAQINASKALTLSTGQKQNTVASKKPIPVTALHKNKSNYPNKAKHQGKQNNVTDEYTVTGENGVPHETMAQDKEPQPTREALTTVLPSIVPENEDNSIVTDKIVTDSLRKKMMPLSGADALSKTTTAAIIPIQRKRSNTWHWGVEADAGFSRIATSSLFQLKGLLSQEKYLAADVADRSYSVQNGTNTSGSSALLGSTAAQPVKKAAPIQPDFSFSACAFVEKIVSPHFRLSIGLRYAYMSVNTMVGPEVHDTILVNYGRSSAKMVQDYYKREGESVPSSATPGISGLYNPAIDSAVSQKYRYRFQYIEIPLLVHWQINKGRKLPPFVLNGGFSVTRLIGVDALHYEGLKGVYYKDDDLFNKMQLNFNTGLSVGLWQRTNHPLWVGPNLRYALTGLVKKEVSTGQYFWSTGISVKMLLGRL